MTRGSRWKLPTLIVGLALAGLLAMAGPAAADIVPFVDCVAPGTGTVNVYFGYTNDGEPASIPFGEFNAVFPGIEYQGQPTVFNKGTYQRVFRAVWNQTAFLGIAWELNGHQALATSTSPTCIAGATGPTSDLTPTTATLSAVVGVAGQRTSYSFEYGTGESFDLSTPVATVDVGQHSFVTQPLTGLTPGSVYHYRVVATDEDGTTQGEPGTFTTPSVPKPTTETTTTGGGGTSEATTLPGGGGTSGATTSPGGGGTSGNAGAPAGSPFAISVRAGSARRQLCAPGVAGGVVITSNDAGTASISAKVGKRTVATRQVQLVNGPNVVTLCLNKAGRGQMEAATGGIRPLRAHVVVAAQAGTETARASVPLSFTRGRS